VRNGRSRRVGSSPGLLASVRPGIENTGAVPIEERPRAISHRRRAARGRTAGNRQWANAAVANDDVAAAAESVRGTATDMPAASDEPKSIVEAALADSSQMLAPGITARAGGDSEHA